MTTTPTLRQLLATIVIPRADGRGNAPFGQIAAPHQWAVVDAMDDPRIRWVVQVAHRGAAKSTTAVLIALGRLLQSPLPIRTIILSTDLDAGKVLVRIARVLTLLNPTLGKELRIQQSKIVRERTGGEIEVMSSDAASFYGQLPDLIICDELSHWPPAAARLWQAVASTLPKRSDLELLVLSNSGWTDSWQYPIFQQFETTPWCWCNRVEGFAPWIDSHQLEVQRRLLPESAYRRLWQNEWVAGSGDLLASDDIDAAITEPGPLWIRPEGTGAVCGLDVGIKRDRTGAVILTSHWATGRVRLAWCRTWAPVVGGQVDLDRVRHEVLAACRQLRCGVVLFDPYQCEHLAQLLRRDGLYCESMPYTAANMTRMAATMLQVFRDRAIDLYPDDELVAGLRRLSIEERATGYKLIAPRDAAAGHADAAFALAVALPVALENATAPPATINQSPDTVTFGPGLPGIPIGEVTRADDLRRLLRMKDEYEARVTALTGGF